MTQEFNDLRKYMNLVDRTDPKKWAWPGEMSEVWEVNGAEEQFLSFFGPEATVEGIREEFDMIEVSTGILTETYWTDEYRNAVVFEDAYAKACPEEPDAPDCHLRLCLPANYSKDDKLPVILYSHGAGYMFTAKLFDVEYAHYVKDLNCAVVSVDYRPYPEYMFPAQVNDLHAAYLWIVEHGSEYGLDSDRIVTAGNSFGGLLSVAICHRLKRYDAKPMLRGVVAVSPLLDDRQIGTSGRYYWKNGGQPSPYSYALCWSSYLGYANGGNAAITPEAFPNHAFADECLGLPPMAIHITEHDVQRDAEIQYCQKLYDAGVFCSMHCWGGTKHGFALTAQLATSKDPFFMRVMSEMYADFRGFFDNDFRRV